MKKRMGSCYGSCHPNLGDIDVVFFKKNLAEAHERHGPSFWDEVGNVCVSMVGLSPCHSAVSNLLE